MDYKSFENNGKKSEKSVSKKWWKCPVGERSASVTSTLEQIINGDKARQQQYITSMRLYGGVNGYGLSGYGVGKVPSQAGIVKDRITYNVVQSAGDTITAKIAKNKPKPMFLTSGGDYKLQRKAKKLDKFMEGIFYENKVHALATDCFRDAFILGDGIAHVFAENGKVKVERDLATQYFTDWAESIYGEPKQLHKVKNVDRDTLMEMFPEHKDTIKDFNNIQMSLSGSMQNVSDQLTVVESWHIKSGKKAKDGLHSINLLGGINLLDEKWDKERFPIARMSWSKRQVGYWSQGGAEQIQSTQLEINKILWTIQRSYQLAGSFKVWMKIGSRIVKEHINNEIGAIIESEEAPQYLTPPIVPPEMYEQLREKKRDAFELSGISQLSATSQKPAGLNSGKAIRAVNDIESERFMTIGHSYEDFHLDITYLAIDCARDIFKKAGKLTVKSVNKRFIETIDWKDVALDDDDMIMQIFPVSSLPSDPAGRLQTVQEYVQAGFLSPRAGAKLLDFPDIEAVEELKNSKEDYLHKILEEIIDDGEFTPPEPFDDLQLAKELVLEYYAQGKCNGLEEDKLEMLRMFSDQVDILIQKSLPPQQSPVGSTPQANPMAPPQSDLVPNIPQAA